MKGNFYALLESLKKIGDIEGEIYFKVNRKEDLIKLIDSITELNISIEISPYPLWSVGPEKKESVQVVEEEENFETNDMEILRKFKQKKKEATSKTFAETEEKVQEKPEQTGGAPPPSAREEKKADKAEVQESDAGVLKEATNLVAKVESEELSFSELMKMKESAFNRKLVE